MCGEHRLDGIRPCTSRGSSPHVRGARPWRDCQAVRAGIIPACAGSTLSNLKYWRTDGDHPRMCGEHWWRPLRLCPIWGSSPHVRGAPTACRIRSAQVGIIPACAGSTASRIASMVLDRDHPRMCGEHSLRIILRIWALGSSPHVRGALHDYLSVNEFTGIIPACAGSTRL